MDILEKYHIGKILVEERKLARLVEQEEKRERIAKNKMIIREKKEAKELGLTHKEYIALFEKKYA